MKKTKERYYAVKIGEHPKHEPYFMLGEDGETPALFTSRIKAADAAVERRINWGKVVRITVTT